MSDAAVTDELEMRLTSVQHWRIEPRGAYKSKPKPEPLRDGP